MTATPTAVENLFLAALARPGAEARAAFLDEACREDAELRRRVEVLLEAHERAGDFLARPAAAPGPTTDGAAEAPGARVGPYKLAQKLGEGGMGVVWVAEQQEPVKRRVALKLIKPGMDSAQVIARFEAERQALALMDHPNIARVLDAGATEAGRPYFVMELVKGVPITKYCDELQLSVRERLGLFVSVCQAIQHAHTKGVLHRDLKPSNVLVAIQDGRPVAKVIDFGVAKALSQRLTERTLMTEVGAVVGTLEYMSPEQAELSALDVDTRADVYCLGVLLYELLTGSTPVTRQRLKQAAFDEALRIIREEEPPRPSTRLTESKESLASLASLRRTEPRKLGAEVAGELDWIVMRCLEKDRTRRYETASGLARDVERHLNGEAVEACPPSVGYRLRKFARRYRRALAMTAVLAVMLLWATIVSAWMALRARQAERVAQHQRLQAEEALREAAKAKQESEEEAANSQAFLNFIRAHLLEQGAPDGAGDASLRLKTVLDQALPKVAKQFGKQPALEAAARHTLGVAYRRIGEAKTAQEQLERATAIREAVLGPRHPDTIASRRELIVLHEQQQNWEKVAELRERVLKLVEAAFGSDHVQAAPHHERLGLHCFDRGDFARSASHFEKAVAIRTKAGLRGTDSPAGPMGSLARVHAAMGRYAEAERLNARVLEIWREELGEHHLNTFYARFRHAMWLSYQGKHDQAKAAARRLQADFPSDRLIYQARMVLSLLGICHLRAGELDEAEKLFRETTRRLRRLSNVDPLTLAIEISLQAEALLGLKRDRDAEPLLRECMKLCDPKDKDGWLRFKTQSQLGGVLLRRGEVAAAEPLIRGGYEGLKEREARIQAAHRHHLRQSLDRLIALCEAQGKTDEAAKRRKELDALPDRAAR